MSNDAWFSEFIGQTRRGPGREGRDVGTASKLDQLDAKLASLAVALAAVREEIAAAQATQTHRAP